MMGETSTRLRSILAILVLVIPIQFQMMPSALPGMSTHADQRLSAARPFASQAGLDLPIPDGAYDGRLASMASSQLTVNGIEPYAGHIEVKIWMDHAAAGDLVIKLQSPDGALLTLLSRPGLDEFMDGGCGGSASAVSKSAHSIIFDDLSTFSAETMDAGQGGIIGDPTTGNPYFFKPARDSESPPDDLASAFSGDPAEGTWTLYIGDGCANDKAGSLDSWSLVIIPATTVTTTIDPPVQGLTFAIDNTSGAGGAIQSLVARYGAQSPLRKVLAELLDQAGPPPDPNLDALIQAYLHQLSYSSPAVSSLTLADFSGSAILLIDDTQVISLTPDYGNTLGGCWLRNSLGLYYARGESEWIDLGTRATPNRDYRRLNKDGNAVILHTTSAHYVGFASYFQPFQLFLPELNK